MLKEHFLYRHIRKDSNEPFYIGIGTKPLKYNGIRTEYKRAYDTSPKKRSIFWTNVFIKSNKDIEVQILFESTNYNLIKQKEQEFILLHGRKDNAKGSLVNLTEGGEGVLGMIVSEKTRKLISEKNIGRKQSEETIRKIKLNHASKQVGYIKIMSEESKHKLSELNTGKYLEREVYCIETGIKYNSIRELCNAMFNGKGASKVISCLSDKYPNISYKGFHFAYDINNSTIENPSYFKKVICIENGKEYINITECAKDIFGDKKYKCSISRSILKNKPYNNFTFKSA